MLAIFLHSISISAGAMMAASCFAGSAGRSTLVARQPLWRRTPPGGVPAGTLPMNFTAVGSPRRRLGVGAFHAIDHRRQGHVAGQRLAALVVQAAHGRSHLVVGIGRDVFHDEVDQARIALQDGENLQRAVGGADHGSCGRRRDGLRRRARLSAARG